MAGDWIKWVKGLAKRPEVIDMSVALGRPRHEIAGILCEVWEWADDNVDPADASVSCPGLVRMRSASSHTIDALVGVPGLADAMLAVEWLQVRNGSIVFPKFGRHNGKHAKGRALDAERKRKERNKTSENCPDSNRTETGPEERREEKSKGVNPLKPPRVKISAESVPVPDALDTPEVRQSLADWLEYKRQRGSPYKSLKFVARMFRSFTTPEAFCAAVDHSIGCNYQGLVPAKDTPKPGGLPPARDRIATDEDLASWRISLE